MLPKTILFRTLALSYFLSLTSPSLAADAADDTLLIIDGEENTVLELDSEESEGLVIEEGGTDVEAEGSGPSDEIVLEAPVADSRDDQQHLTFKVDKLWAEYGQFTDSNSEADREGYLHGLASVRWTPSARWEMRAAARIDGHFQSGGSNADTTRLDYDESFLRYRSDDFRLTLGAEKVIWGRIDEVPPTDRLSVRDLSRYILDDLPDRRRATPIVRLETFMGQSKLDLVWLPVFQEAVLPEKGSVWYPINRTTGEIFGVDVPASLSAAAMSSPIETDAPNTDGGFGIRYSRSTSKLDFSVTLQKARQSTPYFEFDQSAGVFRANYPRSWVIGGDLSTEAAGATWRLEGAWFSDIPATELDGSYTTVKSISYGAGVEFYPGDGDARVNLQLTGLNLLDHPQVLDRADIYSFNGSFDIPLAHNRWRANTRFYFGLDTKDIYINPEIAYVAMEPSEFYLQAHYFDGNEGTPGHFHQDHSLVTVGWRASF